MKKGILSTGDGNELQVIANKADLLLSRNIKKFDQLLNPTDLHCVIQMANASDTQNMNFNQKNNPFI